MNKTQIETIKAALQTIADNLEETAPVQEPTTFESVTLNAKIERLLKIAGEALEHAMDCCGACTGCDSISEALEAEKQK